MKLYKKAAACLLTAVMAISMLTACGGGGGTPGKPGGNTPSTLPTNPDEIVLPDTNEDGGEGGGGGTETKPTKTPIIDVNNSKLAQFKNRYGGATEFYFEMQTLVYENGDSTDVCVAQKGEDAYESLTVSGKNQKQRTFELLMLKNKSTWDQYRLLRSSKVAVTVGSTNEVFSLSTLITDKLPDQMWSTKVKVGSTEYDAEVYDFASVEHTICYTADGKPVYQFDRDLSNGKLVVAWLYKTIQAGSGTSKNLCKLPSGFKTYSFDWHTGKLIDANDNVFTVEYQTNSAGDLTDFTVRDTTGQDVSADFKWFADFYEMMS